jgi:PAS domain-containing protein
MPPEPAGAFDNEAFAEVSERPRESGLRTHLRRSHMAVAAIGLAALVVTLIVTARIHSQTAALAGTDVPMVRAAVAMIAGVEDSLASLDSWVTIDNPTYAENRNLAWSEQIRPSMASLLALTREAAPTERESVGEIARGIDKLEDLQTRMLGNITREPGGTSVSDLKTERLELLQREVAPQSRRVVGMLTALSEKWNRKAATDAERLNRLTRGTLGALALLLPAMAGLAWILSRRGTARLMKPITELTAATRQLAEGGLDHDIAVVGADELGQLTVSINRMRTSFAAAEEGMRHREEECFAIIEASPSGMIVVNRDGEILMLNKRAATLFGYARDELLGEMIELLPDSHRDWPEPY